ncbi:polysaccharide export protein [Vibrio sp. SM6]|uniref:Polysaccharide export protein n=1 Tax=Vibrio agarilyticus TaxID=2726741 RepID=A0A7X8YFV5_9VIBR|nr:polysaccharide biosynthesis/export family protein [Vibrio agarilyticus]NLS11741.1 polysaccharide export protein [Vibrio agarilyticus]
MRHTFWYWLSVIALTFTTTAHAEEALYTIGPGDTITIQVYGEPNLSLDSILVSPDGHISYPYLGRVRVIDKTTNQLQNEISRGLKGDYLVNPKVMVSMVRYRPFYVNGEVRQPGGFEFSPGMTVEKAIALAGGLTDRASRGGINLTRHKSGRTLSDVSMTVPVHAGDIIFVDESFF